MHEPTRTSLTIILEAASRGDLKATQALLPLVYDELRKLARWKMVNEKPGFSLQATDLVHEAYLRVIGDHDPGWENRNHFFAAAGEAMRRILVNQARRKARLKHGGDRDRVALDDVHPAIEPPSGDILDVNRALETLEERSPRKRQIVNLRYFAGLSTEETAAALSLSVTTIEREWTYIRAWLQRALADPRSDS